MMLFCSLLLSRSLLEKPGLREAEVLKQCRRAEQVLHTLPCSWAWLDSQSWDSTEELVKVVRSRIFQEQTRILWVDNDEM